jgi:hypothetical protein
MNLKMIAPLVIMTAATSLGSQVQAQSPATSNSNSKNYSLTGDSLLGIDHRTSEDDFTRFFEQNPGIVSSYNDGKNTTPKKLRLEESPSSPNTSDFFLPTQSFNGNDGAQLKLDLGNQ